MSTISTEHKAKGNKLSTVIDKLTPAGKKAAISLVSYLHNRYTWTAAQEKFVDTLIEQGVRVARATKETTEALEEIEKDFMRIPGFNNVTNMLLAAGQRIKWPCIRLQASDDTRLNLRPTANKRGVKLAFLKSDTKPLYIYDEKIYPVPQPVYRALCDLVADTQKYVTHYGIQTGSCSFCGDTLTNAGSISVGYGPICAQNYGLPHPLNGDMPNWEVDKFVKVLSQ